jgi:hypothetical protein
LSSPLSRGKENKVGPNKEFTIEQYLSSILNEVTDVKEAVESLELQAECIPPLLERIADSLDAISLSLDQETLTEAVNNLAEAIREGNTIKIGDGDGVKIWPKGEVKIYSPYGVERKPGKQAKPRESTSTADKIEQQFDERRQPNV